MIKVAVFHQQWALPSPIRPLRKFPSCLVHCPLKFRLSDAEYPTLTSSFVASASSAHSVGGSGAEYSEQLLDIGTKRKGIAGIDQDELVDSKLLADPDSCFCEFKGVHIHHKIYDGESQAYSMFKNRTLSQLPHKTKELGFPMILLHGFGASVFSWKTVMKLLAEVSCSKVLAFDRPAFGLTSRVDFSSGTDVSKSLNPYSMVFSVLATLHFIDLLNADKEIRVGYVDALSSVG